MEKRLNAAWDVKLEALKNSIDEKIKTAVQKALAQHLEDERETKIKTADQEAIMEEIGKPLALGEAINIAVPAVFEPFEPQLKEIKAAVQQPQVKGKDPDGPHGNEYHKWVAYQGRVLPEEQTIRSDVAVAPRRRRSRPSIDEANPTNRSTQSDSPTDEESTVVQSNVRQAQSDSPIDESTRGAEKLWHR